MSTGLIEDMQPHMVQVGLLHYLPYDALTSDKPQLGRRMRRLPCKNHPANSKAGGILDFILSRRQDSWSGIDKGDDHPVHPFTLRSTQWLGFHNDNQITSSKSLPNNSFHLFCRFKLSRKFWQNEHLTNLKLKELIAD